MHGENIVVGKLVVTENSCSKTFLVGFSGTYTSGPWPQQAQLHHKSEKCVAPKARPQFAASLESTVFINFHRQKLPIIYSLAKIMNTSKYLHKSFSPQLSVGLVLILCLKFFLYVLGTVLSIWLLACFFLYCCFQFWNISKSIGLDKFVYGSIYLHFLLEHCLFCLIGPDGGRYALLAKSRNFPADMSGNFVSILTSSGWNLCKHLVTCRCGALNESSLL
jgi:hypothetical protein